MDAAVCCLLISTRTTRAQSPARATAMSYKLLSYYQAVREDAIWWLELGFRRTTAKSAAPPRPPSPSPFAAPRRAPRAGRRRSGSGFRFRFRSGGVKEARFPPPGPWACSNLAPTRRGPGGTGRPQTQTPKQCDFTPQNLSTNYTARSPESGS
jgi:hypothetical protein